MKSTNLGRMALLLKLYIQEESHGLESHAKGTNTMERKHVQGSKSPELGCSGGHMQPLVTATTILLAGMHPQPEQKSLNCTDTSWFSRSVNVVVFNQASVHSIHTSITYQAQYHVVMSTEVIRTDFAHSQFLPPTIYTLVRKRKLIHRPSQCTTAYDGVKTETEYRTDCTERKLTVPSVVGKDRGRSGGRKGRRTNRLQVSLPTYLGTFI